MEGSSEETCSAIVVCVTVNGFVSVSVLAEAAADLLGYMIYLGVFAAPVWYFYTKKKEDEA